MIRLMRTISLGYDIGGSNDGGGRVSSRKLELAKAKKSTTLVTFKDLTERVQTASWWPLPAYDRTSTTQRELQGEIHLPPTIGATAHLGRYDYYVRIISQIPSLWNAD